MTVEKTRNCEMGALVKPEVIIVGGGGERLGGGNAWTGVLGPRRNTEVFCLARLVASWTGGGTNGVADLARRCHKGPGGSAGGYVSRASAGQTGAFCVRWYITMIPYRVGVKAKDKQHKLVNYKAILDTFT